MSPRQFNPLPVHPNVPVTCLMPHPHNYVVYDLKGPVGNEFLEQGFVLNNGIIQPEKVGLIDLSQPAISKIVSTLVTFSGDIVVDGLVQHIGLERLTRLKADIISGISGNLLCGICPLKKAGKCGPRFVIDEIQDSIGVFPHPEEGVDTIELKKNFPRRSPYGKMPLAG